MKTIISTRDKFALSLGGMTAVAAFAPMPAIAHDRLYQVRENRPRQGSAACDYPSSLRLLNLEQATRSTFA